MKKNDSKSTAKQRTGNQIFWHCLLWTCGWAAFFGFSAASAPDDFFNLYWLKQNGMSVQDAIIEMMIYFVPITLICFIIAEVCVYWLLKLTGFTASVAQAIFSIGLTLAANSLINPWL